MATGKKMMPWYKAKYPMEKYLKYGPPRGYYEEDLAEMPGWIPVGEEEMALWQEAKLIVDQKNNNREFKVEYEDQPQRSKDGLYVMEIKILHVDRRGFIFTAEGFKLENVQRRFWPTVSKLIALLINPRLKKTIV